MAVLTAEVSKIPPLLTSIEDTRTLIGGTSRQTIYDLINAGDIESVRIGGRRFVVVESINALIERSKIKKAS